MARTPDELRASARAIDNARRAGLPDHLVGVYLAIVAARRGGPWPPTGLLREYVDDPRTRGMDEVVWWAARRRLKLPDA